MAKQYRIEEQDGEKVVIMRKPRGEGFIIQTQAEVDRRITALGDRVAELQATHDAAPTTLLQEAHDRLDKHIAGLQEQKTKLTAASVRTAVQKQLAPHIAQMNTTLALLQAVQTEMSQPPA
jgi:hypothetical protein